MQRSYHDRPYEFRPRGGRRRGTGSYRGRGARNDRSNLTQRFINVSSDGSALHYSQLGTDDFGDSSLINKVIESRKVIGNYSEDSERNFVNDKSYLHFLHTKYLPDSDSKEKVVNLDLNVSEVTEYSSTGSKDIENFLTWIINNREVYDTEFNQYSVLKGGGKFIMQKRVLSNILSVPYRFRNEFKIYACSFNGVIYIQKEYVLLAGDIKAVWAHKFEQYMTEEDTNKALSCNEEFRAVMTSNLGPHKLLLSMSLDCANPEEFEDDFTDLSSFINLKCLEKTDEFNYRFQTLYWYLNYVVNGVPKTLTGQRDENGIVRLLKLYDVSDMLSLGQDYWNPANCVFFASEVLSFIKNKVESEPGSVFCFRKESGRAEITCIKDLEHKNFLPEWFVQEIFEAKNSVAENNVEEDEEEQ